VEIAGGVGTTPVRVNRTLPSAGDVTDFQWSPDGTKIAYLADHDAVDCCVIAQVGESAVSRVRARRSRRSQRAGYVVAAGDAAVARGSSKSSAAGIRVSDVAVVAKAERGIRQLTIGEPVTPDGNIRVAGAVVRPGPHFAVARRSGSERGHLHVAVERAPWPRSLTL
jgi:hypothetical protein